MERLSRGELLSEIARRDELIAQLQEELGMFRMREEKRERMNGKELEQDEDARSGGGGGGERLLPQSPIEQQQRPFISSCEEFTHARKIAVSAESGQTQKTTTASGLMRSNGERTHKKDKNTTQTIRSAILSNEFLRQLEPEEIGQMIERMEPLEMETGTQIVRQGELSSELFVLEEGRVQVTKDRRFIRVMEGPCVFGELAILYHCERTATVIALTHCRLWALHRTSFHTLMVHNAKSRQEQNFNHLKRCRQLSDFLEDGQLQALAGQVREEFWQFRTEVEWAQIRGRICDCSTPFPKSMEEHGGDAWEDILKQ